MNAVEIKKAITEFSELKFYIDELPFKFLTAFGTKETTINRLCSGNNIFILFKFMTNIF